MTHPFNKKFIKRPMLKRVAAKHLTIFLKRIRRGLDAKGEKFDDYSAEYKDLKKRGFMRKDGKGRLKLMKGIAITSNKTSIPDFTVR